MRSRTAGSLDEGPRVATIFVLRSMRTSHWKFNTRAFGEFHASPLDDCFTAFVARLEREPRSLRRSMDYEKRRHQHHSREAAAHATNRGGFNAQRRNPEREGRRAVQDDVGEARGTRIRDIGVGGGPDARA